MYRLVSILIAILLCLGFFLFGTHITQTFSIGIDFEGQRQQITESKINWRSWNRKTLTVAAQTDKPIFLYLSPFWCGRCTQMEMVTLNHDSVANLINHKYVPIKVDPGRYPNVAERYQLGGYPSSVILTPDGRTIGGGTYLGPDSLGKLLTDIDRIWHRNRPAIEAQANRLRERFAAAVDSLIGRPLSNEVLTEVQKLLTDQFDSTYGGFGTQPKFPLPEVVRFMLGAVRPDGVPLYAEMLTSTLAAQLGLIDTVWGGCYRYARFADWSSPSHEKLLADNAQLLNSYLDAYLATGEENYKSAAEQIIRYMDHFLKTNRGWGFCNSQHADLPAPDGYIEGEDYYSHNDEQRRRYGIPPVDSSIYTEANCYAVRAYLKAAQVLGRDDCRAYAIETLENVRIKAKGADGGLYHDVVNHRQAPFGLLPDQVVCVLALLDAYEMTGDKRYLSQAAEIVDFFERRLADWTMKGLMFELPEEDRTGRMEITIRPYGVNCQAVVALMRLYHLTAETRYRQAAATTLAYLYRVPLASDDLRLCQYANSFLWHSLYPVIFVLISALDASNESFLHELWGGYYPRSIVVQLRTGQDSLRLGELTFPPSEKPILIICRQNSCSAPIEEPEQATAEIRAFLAAY
ncbi:MAG: thioredoxin domain-containing protein [candidate division Zixibacteria bacterium]|nr:thioredoxin domain-containing protein [candidate division Zixibacteria bacterium]